MTTKTAKFELSLRPNQGWWVNLYIDGANEGVTHDHPLGSATGARRFAEEKAGAYQRNGYATRVCASNETIR